MVFLGDLLLRLLSFGDLDLDLLFTGDLDLLLAGDLDLLLTGDLDLLLTGDLDLCRFGDLDLFRFDLSGDLCFLGGDGEDDCFLDFFSSSGFPLY